jgi:putative flippase GtrA
MALVVKYTLFAIIATVANILCQDAVNRVYHGQHNLYPSMFLGTLAGLVVKYILDKKYIFFFKSKNLFQDGQKFIFYASMGVITTFIFWGVEMVFDYTFKTIPMRYIGAVIGLSIGYWMKYQLDKRFVFRKFV